MIPEKDINTILKKTTLNEERGVAAYKYRETISEIVDYCQRFIKETPKMFFDVKGMVFNYAIQIPEEYLEKFDIFENLSLTVFLREYVGGDDEFGGGGTYPNLEDHVSGDKLKDVVIQIYGFCYEGRVFTRTLYNSLYHELNHCYEFMSRKSSSYNVYKNIINQYDVIKTYVFSHFIGTF